MLHEAIGLISIVDLAGVFEPLEFVVCVFNSSREVRLFRDKMLTLTSSHPRSLTETEYRKSNIKCITNVSMNGMNVTIIIQPVQDYCMLHLHLLMALVLH